MIRLTPRLLIATAGALVGLGASSRDHQPGGPIDQICLAQTSQPHHATWDVPLIQHCGYWAHFDYRAEQSAWPIPTASTAAELATFGLARGVIHESPEEGDIFLQYSPKERSFVHAGIVASVTGTGRLNLQTLPYFDVASIEGDTDPSGGLHGGSMRHVVRRLSPADGDRFLRWSDLDEYDHYLAAGAAAYAASQRRSV